MVFLTSLQSEVVIFEILIVRTPAKSFKNPVFANNECNPKLFVKNLKVTFFENTTICRPENRFYIDKKYYKVFGT